MLHLVLALLQVTTPLSAPPPPHARAPASAASAASAAGRDTLPADAAVFNGREHQLDVRAPQAAERPIGDATFRELEWQRASLLTGFTTYNPVDGRPAQDSTEVRIWYSETALHIGIRAWAPKGTVRATLAERDKIQNDDWVALHLDTFNDQRRSFVFAVNPLGVQADGMRSEQSPGPGVSKASLQAADLSQDFVWQSAGRVLDDGYAAELRIPFKSIRFQMGGAQDWGVQVVRQTQRSGYQDTWAPASRSNQSLLAQEGFLRGMHDLRRGLVLDLTPSSVLSGTGAPVGVGQQGWRYATRNDVSGDARWGVTPNFTVNATANPDFSQIETDVGQIPGDVRFANFYPELRPFFLEGSEQFDAPNKLVNTRSIVKPLGALKITGKIPRTDVGVLSAVDDRITSRDGTSNPMFNIVRLRRDVGEQSTAGLLFTNRTERGQSNSLVGFDSRLQFAKFYSAELRLAATSTRVSGIERRGVLWEANQGRSGRSYGNRYSIQGFSPDFETQAGFVNRVDYVRAQVNQRITRFGKPGGWWDQRQHFVTASSLWTYDDFSQRKSPLELRLSLDNSLQIRGGWKASVIPELQRTAFDPRRYSTLYVARISDDTTTFTPSAAQTTSNVTLKLNTPQWKRVGATLSATIGTEPEFFETASVTRHDAEAMIDFRPTRQLRVGTLLRHQQFVRQRDGTTFSSQTVPRVRLEYQFSRALFLRFVGQMEQRERDALRDPITDRPLVRIATGGGITAQSARHSSQARVDWLLSYLPSPGTVAYFGYGSALDAPDTERPGNFQRTTDGAFVKFSYLFRIGRVR